MAVSAAVYSGLCASFASLCGKLSGLEFNFIDDLRLRYTLKVIFFCMMVVFNSMVWTFFVKALQTTKTVIEATALSTATNYILSGILGFVVFEEVTSLYWWFGISLVVMGIYVIKGSDERSKYGSKAK